MIVRARFPLGQMVAITNPLPGDHPGPWKVVGFNLNVAPPVYKILRPGRKGQPAVTVKVEEGELQVSPR